MALNGQGQEFECAALLTDIEINRFSLYYNFHKQILRKEKMDEHERPFLAGPYFLQSLSSNNGLSKSFNSQLPIY